MANPNIPLSRRDMIRSLAALAGASGARMPAWAMGQTEAPVRGGLDDLPGGKIDLPIGSGRFATGGRSGQAVAVTDSIPGPLIRLKEVKQTILNIHNLLDEDSSIRWHGLLLPFQ